MAFRFSLAAVLRYRESIEQQEYLALRRIQQEIAQTQVRIQQLQKQHSAARQRRDAELLRGLASVDLQIAQEGELALERELDKLQVQLQELERKREQSLNTYQLARQKREVLDHLKLRQLEAYRRTQAKRQQDTLDDVFLSRRWRSH